MTYKIVHLDQFLVISRVLVISLTLYMNRGRISTYRGSRRLMFTLSQCFTSDVLPLMKNTWNSSKCMNVSCCAQKFFSNLLGLSTNTQQRFTSGACYLATYFSPPTFYFSFDGLRMFFLVFTIVVLHLSRVVQRFSKEVKSGIKIIVRTQTVYKASGRWRPRLSSLQDL